MTLKQLLIEEEPAQEISYVPLSSEEKAEKEEVDPELPGDFTQQDDLDVLQDSATALEGISVRIACEGMDLSTARELEQLSPGFMRSAGGHAVFTHRPSLEGLTDAAKTVKTKLAEIMRKLREFIVKLYTSFRDWLKAKLSKTDTAQLTQELNEFTANRNNRNAIQYISDLPDTEDEAAAEIARFMDGDTAAFATSLTDQLRSLRKRVEALEKALKENPTHYRLAKGGISVKSLFYDATSSNLPINLKHALEVADRAMKSRTGAEFIEQVRIVEDLTAQLSKFENEAVVVREASADYGDFQEVPFEKLFDNIREVCDDMARVDTQKMIKEAMASLDHIVRISEETKMDDVLEMVPEDIPENERPRYAQKIIALYRVLAKAGGIWLRLWKVRVENVQSINGVGKALTDIIDSFQKAVVSAGTSLTDEQKTQLTKALAGKGFKIAF